MALINCPECGKEISTKADHCIHCGYPLLKETEGVKDDIPTEQNTIPVEDDQNEPEFITLEPVLEEDYQESENELIEKKHNRRLKIIIAAIVIVVVLGFIVNNAYQKNIIFNEMVQLLNAGNYEKITELQDEGDFNNKSFLYNYAESRIYFKMGDIDSASSYFDAMKKSYDAQDESKYNEHTSNQIEQYITKLKKLKTQKWIQDGLNLIHQGSYDDATTWFFSEANYNNGKDQSALYDYASSKQSYAKGDFDMAQSYAKDIHYSGYGEKEINDYKNSLTDKKIAQAKNKQASQAKAEAKSKGVSIGMSEDDVRNSSWGSPESINTTTTGDTVHEQWCYANNNYLYFDDGILTTIQN